MPNLDLHPVLCADCRVQLVVGLDENGWSWGYCTKCRQAKPLLKIILEGLAGDIVPPDASRN